jgi:hypothetical protein
MPKPRNLADGAGVQQAFGSTQVTSDNGIQSDTITLDQLVEIAKTIYEKSSNSYAQRGLNPKNKASADKAAADEASGKLEKVYQEMWAEYKMFANEFPLVFRWIVSTLTYSEKALRGYIKNDHQSEWKNHKQMLSAQVSYLVYAFRETHPRASPKELSTYRDNVLTQVVKDNEHFEKAAKEAEKVCKENEANRTALIRKDLMKFAQDAN